MELILICARIRWFILFLRILLRLWRYKDLPSIEVPKFDSSKLHSLLTQESASPFLLDQEYLRALFQPERPLKYFKKLSCILTEPFLLMCSLLLLRFFLGSITLIGF